MSKELSSPESSDSLSLLSGEVKYRSKIQNDSIANKCAKLPCSMRRVNNKGAILLLILSYLVTSAFFYILNVVTRQSSTRVLLPAAGLIMPFAGWLADVRFGRYKVLSCSLWMMWLISLMLISILLITNFKYESTSMIAILIPSILFGIIWSAFQANIIQFGIDQLIEASTSELKSFITWYSWTIITSQVGTYYIQTCVKYNLVAPLIICCNLTLALALKLLFNNVFIKEPKTHNPLKLVYQVIRYAIKHKHPRQRSAFTYCEDIIPSRIDFGKCKYGGPFTTEQVEDVKTLLRMTLAVLVACTLFSVSVERHSTGSKLNGIFKNHAINQSVAECSAEFIFTGFYFISGIILIPLNELIVYPVFHRCLPECESHYKLALGAFLRLGKLVVLLVLVTSSRMNYSKNVEISSNATLSCLFHEPDGYLGAYLDYRWTALPEFLYVASDLIMCIAALEFLCAQAPYSMKGLVLGIGFMVLSLYVPFFYAIDLLYENKSLNWGGGVISCGFWYFMTKISLLITGLVIFFIVMKCYKKRKREDVLPNEQIFAERYYSS